MESIQVPDGSSATIMRELLGLLLIKNFVNCNIVESGIGDSFTFFQRTLQAISIIL